MAPAPPPVAKIAVESRGDVLHLVRQLKAAARTRAEQQGLKGRAQEELESMLDAVRTRLLDTYTEDER